LQPGIRRAVTVGRLEIASIGTGARAGGGRASGRPFSIVL